MITSLKLNLGEALTAEELRVLTEAAMERGTTIERVLYEAAHRFVLSQVRQLSLPFGRNNDNGKEGAR